MSLLTIVTAAEEHLAELPLPTWGYAAIAAGVFILLGFVAWSFRDVSNRHSHKTDHSGEAAHH